MSEEIPEVAPGSPARPEQTEPARNGGKKLPQEHETLSREHEEDRSPADPHDWQDEWDRARWAP